ncbi:Complex1_LYR_dom domain-containing protein [Caenorhabditis elegans]|uniref:Complex1_LYR_dom domain-containing protein n=1 Tax=Caenorhabditis elegans TaxID=6239 RepID=A0A2K5ATR1_CAEEL|nr:Complex1_LYR_dom domain-containing protein [Caenorhabditis elegans]SPC47297.2 Complex1_LYR_dom domain-containing protein [Caenorhabditis elegans]|eukprot:NP_001348710.2 Uncharacterized protein CELE_F53G2.12 [Caenorhabditis elegans]
MGQPLQTIAEGG